MPGYTGHCHIAYYISPCYTKFINYNHKKAMAGNTIRYTMGDVRR